MTPNEFKPRGFTLRILTKSDEDALAELALFTGEATRAKAIWTAIRNHRRLREELREADDRVRALETLLSAMVGARRDEGEAKDRMDIALERARQALKR